jgi:hypothetical protein
MRSVMRKSTNKPQATMPKKLGIDPRGERTGDPVRVTVADTSFLKLQGSIKVGPGSAVEDVKKARELRGTDPL